MKEDSRSKEEILKELEELKEENKGLKKALNSYFPEFSFNQNYFSLLLDSIIIGVVVHNSSGKIIYTNKATENILGLSKDEILGVKDIDPQWKLIHKEGRELYPSEIPSKITLETGTAIFDYTLGVKNNEEITWLSVTSKPIYSLEQEVQFVLVSFSNITDLKITEEQLKRITNFLQSALNAVDLGIWSWDIVSNTVEWSDGVHKIFGLQRDEFKGTYQEYLNLLPEEDRILVENKIQEALTNKDKDYFVQHRLIRKNSDIIWVEGKGKVYRDINGNPTKMLGTIMDISYQKKTEEEIKKNTFLIETAGRIAKLGGWEFNLKKMNIIWSEEVYNIYEIDKNIQPSLKIVYKGFSKKDYLKFKEKSQQALEKFSSFDGEFEITTASNKKRWVRIIGYFEKSQVIDSKRLIGTIQDITEKKLSEEALRQSEKRFEVFYDLATEGLCIFNKEFEVLDSNSAFIELFNLGSKKVLNISLTNILTEDSFNKLKNIMEAGNTIIEPIQLVGKKINGSLFSIQCKFNLLYYKKGLVYIANFIDLTSEKEADRLRALNEEMLAKNELIQKQKEELEYTVSNLNQTQNQLIVSEKLASLGQLIAGIAHELNNPIGAIKATNNNSKILFSDFLSSLKVSVSQLNKLNQIEWDNVFNFIKSI
ncbi:MAG: PAS domain S-box protein, partial [Leptospiraceae bacterium]|nr:PAS domain S-box protein [Leptospiraceae bacterium]